MNKQTPSSTEQKSTAGVGCPEPGTAPAFLRRGCERSQTLTDLSGLETTELLPAGEDDRDLVWPSREPEVSLEIWKAGTVHVFMGWCDLG